MIPLERYNRLKKRLDAIEREREQSIGAMNQLLQRLKQEFGCDTLEAAQSKLQELEREQQEKEAEFDRAFKRFYTKYRRFLEKESRPS